MELDYVFPSVEGVYRDDDWDVRVIAFATTSSCNPGCRRKELSNSCIYTGLGLGEETDCRQSTRVVLPLSAIRARIHDSNV